MAITEFKVLYKVEQRIQDQAFKRYVEKVRRLNEYSKKRRDPSLKSLVASFTQEIEKITDEIDLLNDNSEIAQRCNRIFVDNKLGETKRNLDPEKFDDEINLAAYFCVKGKLPDNLLSGKNGNTQDGKINGTENNKEQPPEVILFDAKESIKIKLNTTHVTQPSSRMRKTPEKPKGSTTTMPKKQDKSNAIGEDQHERVRKRREIIVELRKIGKSRDEIKKELKIDDSLLNKDLIAIYKNDPDLRIRPERRTPEEFALFKEIVLSMSSDYMQKDIAAKLKVSIWQVAYAIQSLRNDGMEISGPKITPSRDPVKESLDRRAEVFMEGRDKVLNEELAIFLGVSLDEAKKVKRRVYYTRRKKT